MAREWKSQTSGNVDSRTMDETLIEVYGCIAFDAMVTRLDSMRGRTWSKADFATDDGTGMDEVLIEIYRSVVPESEQRLRVG